LIIQAQNNKELFSNLGKQRRKKKAFSKQFEQIAEERNKNEIVLWRKISLSLFSPGHHKFINADDEKQHGMNI
jgi:hypothetical protein